MKTERIEAIRKEYEIDSLDLDEIKVELKRQLAKEHPDNNAGKCDIENFEKIKDDFEYVESLLKNNNTNFSMIPMDEVLRAVLDLTKNTQLSKSKKDELQDKLEASIDTQMNNFRKRFKRQRYSLSTVTAILTFLWMIPREIASHPVIQIVINEYNYNIFVLFLTVLWVFACTLTGVYWLKTAREERMEKNLLERIKLENFQNEIFMGYMNRFKRGDTFSKTDFMDHLGYIFDSPIDRYNLYLMKNRKAYVREEVIQGMADIILNRAIEHGVIRKTDSLSLVDCYMVEKKDT